MFLFFFFSSLSSYCTLVFAPSHSLYSRHWDSQTAEYAQPSRSQDSTSFREQIIFATTSSWLFLLYHNTRLHTVLYTRLIKCLSICITFEISKSSAFSLPKTPMLLTHRGVDPLEIWWARACVLSFLPLINDWLSRSSVHSFARSFIRPFVRSLVLFLQKRGPCLTFPARSPAHEPRDMCLWYDNKEMTILW